MGEGNVSNELKDSATFSPADLYGSASCALSILDASFQRRIVSSWYVSYVGTARGLFFGRAPSRNQADR